MSNIDNMGARAFTEFITSILPILEEALLNETPPMLKAMHARIMLTHHGARMRSLKSEFFLAMQ